MILLLILCSTQAGNYLAHKAIVTNHDTDDVDDRGPKFISVGLSVAISLLWACFFALEVKQIISDKLDYLKDYWNWLDMVSLSLNLAFLVMIDIDLLADQVTIPVTLVRNVGAFSCFLLWIKVFYWMRLFKLAAHFITLIKQTIFDIRIFLIMLLILTIAFANLFFVLNNNTDDSFYSKTHTGASIVDSLINTYLLSLGNFNLDDYNKGPNVAAIWLMFILGTFLIIIVFFNMLIAIMSETFAQIQAA